MATKRSLDLLPLLDVFMVVLFVFATIQEGELDDSEQQNETLEAKAAAAEAKAKAATELLERVEAELEAELEVQTREAARASMLDAENQQFRQACGPRQPGGDLCPAANAEAKQLAELTDVQQRMLGAIAVFEVEIGGKADLDTGKLLERCCYRSDPPDGEWSSCGDLPRTRQDRQDWFDAGADGLREALRETREGGAIVLLRQSELASHNAGSDLAELLRARLPDHYVYDDGIGDQLLCPLL